MTVILIVGDGIGDRPVMELKGKTPLQAAEKPFMDKISRLGICGIMDPISPGVTPQSHTAHLSIFGYDPYYKKYSRGPFEALGSGLTLESTDVSFRCDFASVNHKMLILNRRAGRINNGGDELGTALNNVKVDSFPEVQLIFKHTIEHRGAMILRGAKLSPMVSDSDTGRENIVVPKVNPLNNTPEAIKTAKILNELTIKFHKILDVHPLNIKRGSKNLPVANAILFRGAGVLPNLKPITKTYGIKALVVAGGAMYKGVGMAVGMDHIDVFGATGTVETDTLQKAKATVDNLEKYDYVFVHVKGTDSCSHDKNIWGKVKMIEKIDALLEYIFNNTRPEEITIAVTGDHTTPVEIGEHKGDPVPIAIMGPGVRRDSVKQFSEADCAEGGLGRIKGVNLTPILMNLIKKSKKFKA